MAKKSLKDVKLNNVAQVMGCVMDWEPVSRIEISERSGLAPSTVSQAISLLMKKGVVEETKEGESTGGRKPILLRIKPDYGCVVTLAVKRDGVIASVYDLCGQLLQTKELASKMLAGNRLLDVLCRYVKSIQKGEEGIPARITGVGLLCQDDIPEYDLMTEFTTSLSSDVLRMETALAASCDVRVKKELLNRYSLDYYLRTVDAEYKNYAYINLGERIRASFVLNKTLVKSADDTVFDISSAVLTGNYAGAESGASRSIMLAQELALKKLSPEILSEKLSQVIKSALLFFPVRDVFIGGQAEHLDKIVEMVAQKFPLNPVIRKLGAERKDIGGVFAHQIWMENYKYLVETF